MRRKLNRPELSSYIYLLLVFISSVALVPQATAKDVTTSIVVLYVEFSGSYEIGTGAFVDHDGLILTADHVIHKRPLAVPATLVRGALPTRVTPLKITVYSPAFPDPLYVDLSDPNSVVDGTLDATTWMDVAFVRLKLSDIQRARIEPLDISPAAPVPSDPLDAYGPLCPQNDPKCFVPFAVATTLGVAASLSRDYQVRNNTTLGYSGGPLVNASGDIVAIQSWGDISVGNQLVRASFIPSKYILQSFRGKLPPSAWFNGPQGCANIHSLMSLTVFDSFEALRPLNLSDQAQCLCCCETLDKAKNSIDLPLDNHNCVPPFCPERRFQTLRRSIELAAATDSVDKNTVADYQALAAVYKDLKTMRLAPEVMSQRSTEYAVTLSYFAKDQNRLKSFPEFSTVADEGLRAAADAIRVKPTPDLYSTMGDLFRAKGDHVHAVGADAMAAIGDLTPKEAKVALRVDTTLLKNQLIVAAKKDTGGI